MTLVLREDERGAIEAVLRFANLPEINSDAAVERCFRGLVDFDEFRPRPSGRANELTISDLPHYADLQDELRRVLDLAARSERGRRDVAHAVALWLSESVTIAPSFEFKARRLTVTHWFQSVEAACAFGLALILDERGGLARRLARCGWSGCRRFNLDLSPKGRPRRFCSDDHKARWARETGSARVKDWRRRKAKLAERKEQR